MTTDECEQQCVDITFAEPEDVEPVTPDNCANTTDISFQYVYSTNLGSGASSLVSRNPGWVAAMAGAAAIAFTTL